MAQLFVFIFLSSLILNWSTPIQAGEDPYAESRAKYPRIEYWLGIGETALSGNRMQDKRKAEVFSRVEIAKQIEVKIEEESLDVMCEKVGKLFADDKECQSETRVVIKSTVDLILRGSEIIQHGADTARGIYYAIALLPKKQMAPIVEMNIESSRERAKALLNEAEESKRKGNQDLFQKDLAEARQELLKAMAFDSQKKLIASSASLQNGKTARQTEGEDPLLSRLTNLTEEIRRPIKHPDSPVDITGVAGQKPEEKENH